MAGWADVDDLNEGGVIEKLLKKWKSRLGLSDWDITVKFRDAVDLDDNIAATIVRASLQSADMRLLNKGDRKASDPVAGDMELDLVHELVHVRLWAIDPTDAEGVLHQCREQAIEWIAKALVNLDRQNKGELKE